ncbi:MAG: RNA-binding protein [Longimicrobiales bacterium]
MARAFAEPDDATKLRSDVNETAFRVMREATSQAPKTAPPGERPDDEKDPEAVKRGKRGGEKRAESLSPDELDAAAQVAALARWKNKDD